MTPPFYPREGRQGKIRLQLGLILTAASGRLIARPPKVAQPGAPHPAFETAVEQLKFAREAPQKPQWSAAYSVIGEAMTSIVGNDAPALETLQAAEIKVDALLGPVSKSKP
jgi:hypothetical protein